MLGAWPDRARAVVIGAPVCAALVLALCGCGSSAPTPSTTSSAVPADLLAQARPIGRGARFHPPATGPVVGSCKSKLGARVGAHVELFAANRVVLIAAGIGTRPPLRYSAGRIASARCYWRPRDAGADRGRARAARSPAHALGPFSVVGAAVVRAPSCLVLGCPGPERASVRERPAPERPAGRGAPERALGDRARGRARACRRTLPTHSRPGPEPERYF